MSSVLWVTVGLCHSGPAFSLYVLGIVGCSGLCCSVSLPLSLHVLDLNVLVSYLCSCSSWCLAIVLKLSSSSSWCPQPHRDHIILSSCCSHPHIMVSPSHRVICLVLTVSSSFKSSLLFVLCPCRHLHCPCHMILLLTSSSLSPAPPPMVCIIVPCAIVFFSPGGDLSG
jgi:hypothetical protein